MKDWWREIFLCGEQVPLPYPSAILIREKAICVSLEHIRMVVGTDKASRPRQAPLFALARKRLLKIAVRLSHRVERQCFQGIWGTKQHHHDYLFMPRAS